MAGTRNGDEVTGKFDDVLLVGFDSATQKVGRDFHDAFVVILSLSKYLAVSAAQKNEALLVFYGFAVNAFVSRKAVFTPDARAVEGFFSDS